jgi:hypothetical protein
MCGPAQPKKPMVFPIDCNGIVYTSFMTIGNPGISEYEEYKADALCKDISRVDCMWHLRK